MPPRRVFRDLACQGALLGRWFVAVDFSALCFCHAMPLFSRLGRTASPRTVGLVFAGPMAVFSCVSRLFMRFQFPVGLARVWRIAAGILAWARRVLWALVPAALQDLDRMGVLAFFRCEIP